MSWIKVPWLVSFPAQELPLYVKKKSIQIQRSFEGLEVMKGILKEYKGYELAKIFKRFNKEDRPFASS